MLHASAAALSRAVKAVPRSTIREMFDMAGRIEDLINLGIGEPDFDTPPGIVAAAKKAMDEGYTHYTANAGLLELRSAIAQKLNNENRVTADAEKEIIVTSGAMGALALAMLTVVERGDEVLLPQPGWCNYRAQAMIAGGTPVTVALKAESGFMLRASDVEKSLTPKTKLLVVNSPSNPTGSVVAPEEIGKLAALVKRHGFWVISDEVYEKFLYDGATHLSLASFPEIRERVILVNSFSKAFSMTGWRVGFAAAQAAVIAEMTKLQEHLVACASTISQKAALSALQSPPETLKGIHEEYAVRRDMLAEGLDGIEGVRYVKPTGTFYLFAGIRQLGLPSTEFAIDLLNRERLCVIPGSAFGPEGEGFLRISFAASRENIAEGLKRLASYVRSLGAPREQE